MLIPSVKTLCNIHECVKPKSLYYASVYLPGILALLLSIYLAFYFLKIGFSYS